MIAHCTAAALGKCVAVFEKIQSYFLLFYIMLKYILILKLIIYLVSENKTLCHPASVDSLSTSAGTEDHVSMGGFAARKALQVVRNVEKVS